MAKKPQNTLKLFLLFVLSINVIPAYGSIKILDKVVKKTLRSILGIVDSCYPPNFVKLPESSYKLSSILSSKYYEPTGIKDLYENIINYIKKDGDIGFSDLSNHVHSEIDKRIMPSIKRHLENLYFRKNGLLDRLKQTKTLLDADLRTTICKIINTSSCKIPEKLALDREKNKKFILFINKFGRFPITRAERKKAEKYYSEYLTNLYDSRDSRKKIIENGKKRTVEQLGKNKNYIDIAIITTNDIY